MHPSNHPKLRSSSHGGVLITTVLIVAVMSMLTAAILHAVSARHASTYQSVSWNEALSSAENGADFGVRTLTQAITDPATAWAAWTPSDATTFPKTYNLNPPAHIGEGNTKVFSKITVDNSIKDAPGKTWYRIRSTGVAELPSRSINGIEAAVRDSTGAKNHRSVLRKPRFSTDITGGLLKLPQVPRTIEVMTEPVGGYPYKRALTVKNTLNFGNAAIVDSFDSSNLLYSTNGQYDSSKRRANADIASNVSGNLSNLGGAHVYGDASSNGGTFRGAEDVQGNIYNNFQTTFTEIPKPSFSTIEVSPSTINMPASAVTLPGGSKDFPKNYKLSTMTSNGAPVIIAPSAPGVESYVNVWITGNTKIWGNSYVQVEPNVTVRFYFEGDTKVTGNGFVNKSGYAANIQLIGVTPASPTTTPNMYVSGSGGFMGVMNAPAWNLELSGSGDFFGSAIAKVANFNGSGQFHYDEALGRLGGPVISAFQVASWVEDIR